MVNQVLRKVLETKGDQIDNLDTASKRDVVKLMSDSFAWNSTVSAGTMELVQQNGETVECTLIQISEGQTTLFDA